MVLYLTLIYYSPNVNLGYNLKAKGIYKAAFSHPLHVVYTTIPGKLPFRLSILDEKMGQKFSSQQAIIRYLVSLVSFSVFLL